MANFCLRLLAFLVALATLAAAQDTTAESLTTSALTSPDSTDLDPFPTLGPTAPSTNGTFFPGPGTTSRPPYANTSRPIDRPTPTRPDPGATITSWSTEIVTITSCPCVPQPSYEYGHETTVLCTSSRTLTVMLTSTIKDCYYGYGGCKDSPAYSDYPEPTQEPPHYGEDYEEEEGCNEEGKDGGDEGLGECYDSEESCGEYEYSQDGVGTGDRYEGEDRRGEYDESKRKHDYKDKDITYDRVHKGGYNYQETDLISYEQERDAYNEGKGRDVYPHNGKEDGKCHVKKPGEDRHKESQTYEEHYPKYGGKTRPKKKCDGGSRGKLSKDKVIPEVTIARQYDRACTRIGEPKPTDDQKHESTREPTGPGQCHGGCGRPYSTSTVTTSTSTTVIITIAPSVTKIITFTTSHLSVSSTSITPLSTTIATSAQTKTGSATSSFTTGTSTVPSMPTFIAGAARLGRGVQIAGVWGMLITCMWVGMVAIGFGVGF